MNSQFIYPAVEPYRAEKDVGIAKTPEYVPIPHQLLPMVCVERIRPRGGLSFCSVLSKSQRLSGDLVVGAELTANLGAGQDILTVLVKLELGNDDVGGVETQGDGLAGGLVAGDTLDVDNVLETVHGGDLALTALVGAADNGDLVVLADGDAADLF